jgi:hypothetical protein
MVGSTKAFLHPVMPAKQLCETSEHSNLEPPGHGSHTLLALEADAPHFKRFIVRMMGMNIA